MSKKGGYYCAFKNCRALSRRDKRSFFRFPKDPLRSKQWVIACDRNDLLEKTPIELFNSYRVCAKHFTNSMFLNDLRNRLQSNSIPMQLEPEKLQDSLDNNDKTNKSTEIPDPVSKILKNCVLQKISADEFFKATGIRINEPKSSKIAHEEYQSNINPSDHLYSGTKIINEIDKIDTFLPLDITNDNFQNLTGSLSYQDFINSLPVSLTSDISTESSLEINNLPVIISDEHSKLEKLPKNTLDVESHENRILKNFELSELMTQTALKNKLEESTQTDLDFIKKNTKIIQTNLNTKFVSTECTQTDFSFLKDKLLNKKKLRKVKYEMRTWKKKTNNNFDNMLNHITLKQYSLLTEKFFPRKTSEFIKIQAKLFKKKTGHRKYSSAFKKQCSSLCLAGPKTYKSLGKIFCLPEEKDLQI